MPMLLKYLGTGSTEGIPSPFCGCKICQNARAKDGREVRHRTSVLLDDDLLIDLTPDTFSQSVAYRMNLTKLNYLLFTHSHPDHFYVEELINFRPPYSDKTEGTVLTILSSSATLNEIKNQLSPARFEMLSPYLRLEELRHFTPHPVGPYTITPLKARHGSQIPFIYIIEKDGKRLLYGSDSGFFPEETWDYIAGMYFDFVSLDCTHVAQSGTPGHMSIEDDVTTKKRMFQQGNIDGSSRIAATHFSHNCGLTYYEIDERLRLYGIITSYDGMEVKI